MWELDEEGKERGSVQTRLHKGRKEVADQRMWVGGQEIGEQRGRRARWAFHEAKITLNTASDEEGALTA